MEHLGGGAQPEQLGGQVRGLVDARRGIGILARRLLELCHHLGHAAQPRLRVDHQHVGEGNHVGQRHEVLRMVGQLLVGAVVDGMRAGVADQQRVAVRRGAQQGLRADNAAAAGLVVDHHGLAKTPSI
ncbi:hypothetical protein D9M72_370900 [compost metagenome]